MSLSHINDEDSLEEGEEEAELVEVKLEDVEEEIHLVTDCVNDSDSGGAKLFTPENTLCDFDFALKICKQKMIKKEPVQVPLSFEPMNRRDENTILAHASPDDSWKPIGYIPGLKVAKVTQAMKNKEIVNMSINSIKYPYIFSVASFKYIATVTIINIEI